VVQSSLQITEIDKIGDILGGALCDFPRFLGHHRPPVPAPTTTALYHIMSVLLSRYTAAITLYNNTTHIPPSSQCSHYCSFLPQEEGRRRKENNKKTAYKKEEKKYNATDMSNHEHYQRQSLP
jgi:hypothetical protein